MVDGMVDGWMINIMDGRIDGWWNLIVKCDRVVWYDR